MATHKLYLDDPEVLEASATVVCATASEEGETMVVLDRSPFYPQGGGQPSDIGLIRSGETVLDVKLVKVDVDGVVKHFGTLSPAGKLETGSAVACSVEKRRRVVSTKLHSFGHLLDAAVTAVGWNARLTPSKGYHFEDGPFVEYILAAGDAITSAELEALSKTLTEKAAELIAEAIPTTITSLPREEAAISCNTDLTGYPDEVRVVRLAGTAIPCGGTHVLNTADLGGGWKVGKIKKKKDTLKVGYSSSTLWSEE